MTYALFCVNSGRRTLEYGVRPGTLNQNLTEAMLWALGQALQANFDVQTRAGMAVAALDESTAEMLAGTVGTSSSLNTGCPATFIPSSSS